MAARRVLCFRCEKETEDAPGVALVYCSDACKQAHIESSRTFDDDRYRYGEPTRGIWYPWHRDDTGPDPQDRDGGDR
jgi:hypothetical protein